MRTQNTFIVYPQTKEQVSALKAFMQALKIKFEISKKDEYNPEFVEKIKGSREQVKNGRVTRVEKENLRGFIDSL